MRQSVPPVRQSGFWIESVYFLASMAKSQPTPN
jgi:hypothetical protein